MDQLVLALCSKMFSALLFVVVISPFALVITSDPCFFERLQLAEFSRTQLHCFPMVAVPNSSFTDFVPKLTTYLLLSTEALSVKVISVDPGIALAGITSTAILALAGVASTFGAVATFVTR